MGTEFRSRAASVLVILIVIGSAVSMWSDNLKIKAVIDAGSFDINFSNISTNDPSGSIDPGYDKNVATCYAELVEIENEELIDNNNGPTDDNDLDLSVTIVNGYPSYTCTANFTIVNSGTIPAKLIKWFILPIQPSGGPNQTSILPLDIELIGIYVGYILDPVQSVEAMLKVHVNQSASENSVYIPGNTQVRPMDGFHYNASSTDHQQVFLRHQRRATHNRY